MKAVIVRAFAPYTQAEFGTLPDPQPGPGEVVVDIAASEANFPDLLYMEGNYQNKPPLPFSPGLAGAGRVSALGEGVTELAIGQRVAVLPHYGTHAERGVAPAGFCFPMPDAMPFEVAAALGLVYQTAYFALTERAGMQAGETVLVLGATGGIGMAAIQLAKALGAGMVIAATRGIEGAHFARELGADATIDSGMADLRDGLRDAVRAAAGGGADVVIDPVGGDLGAAALRALAWAGRLVVVGFASGKVPSFPGNYLLVKNITVSGLQWTDYRARKLHEVQAAQQAIFDLWSEGRLRPLISRVLPLERFSEALAELKAGTARGKIVLLAGHSGTKE